MSEYGVSMRSLSLLSAYSPCRVVSLDIWKDPGEASREEGHAPEKGCGEEEGMTRSQHFERVLGR